ncbi:hypothetical protein [Actinoplanes sp. L3-i22]|uniref:hypothetical protein n=1 Tax=Actinoplanes sp. L3-i22 TaxID=2836373 RepID=UPI001C76F2D6|nr:hypothetical protein [Actinoplanes sp. L3-i22]BCY05164.1 hypothetical protein L3i22_002520 [Actinoplanes sp. L3-i22]
MATDLATPRRATSAPAARAAKARGVRLHQVVATQAAAVLLLVGAVLGRPALLLAVICAVLLLALIWLRVRERWAFEWLAAGLRFGARRRTATTVLELAAPGTRVTSADLPGGPVAVLADDFGLTMLLELGDPADLLADGSPELAAPWELLTADGRERPSCRVQLLLSGAPAPAAGAGPIAISYRALTAGRALGHCRAVLAIRVQRDEGWSDAELRRTLTGLARKLAKRLTARPVGKAAAIRLITELTYADPAAGVREEWTALRAGDTAQITFQTRPEVGAEPPAEILTRLLYLPAAATTVSLTADLPEPPSAEPPLIGLSVRLAAPDLRALEEAATSVERLAAAERVRLRRRDGEHLRGLTATLPLGATGSPPHIPPGWPSGHQGSPRPEPAPGPPRPPGRQASTRQTRSLEQRPPAAQTQSLWQQALPAQARQAAQAQQALPGRARSAKTRSAQAQSEQAHSAHQSAQQSGQQSAQAQTGRTQTGQGRSPSRGAPMAVGGRFGRLVLPTARAGVVIGRDRHGQPLPIRLFRPEPTRMLLVGDLRCAQLLTFRSLAVGARVLVRTRRPRAWAPFARGAAAPDGSIALAPPDHPVEPPAGTPLRPLLTILDIDSPPAAAAGVYPVQQQSPATGSPSSIDTMSTNPMDERHAGMLDPAGEQDAEMTDPASEQDSGAAIRQDGGAGSAGPWEATVTLRERFGSGDVAAAIGADLVLLQTMPADDAELIGTALSLGDVARLLTRMRPGMVSIISHQAVRWATLSPTDIEKILIGSPTPT